MRQRCRQPFRFSDSIFLLSQPTPSSFAHVPHRRTSASAYGRAEMWSAKACKPLSHVRQIALPAQPASLDAGTLEPRSMLI